MSGKKLGGIITSVGGGITGLAVVWWFLIYRHFFELVGVGRCLTCLYSSPISCKIGGGLVGLVQDIPTYNPAVFLVGVAALVIGIVITVAAQD